MITTKADIRVYFYDPLGMHKKKKTRKKANSYALTRKWLVVVEKKAATIPYLSPRNFG